MSSNKRALQEDPRIPPQYRRRLIEREGGGTGGRGSRPQRENHHDNEPNGGGEVQPPPRPPLAPAIRRSLRLIEAEAASASRPIRIQEFISTMLVQVRRLTPRTLPSCGGATIQQRIITKDGTLNDASEYEVRNWDALLQSSELASLLLAFLNESCAHHLVWLSDSFFLDRHDLYRADCYEFHYAEDDDDDVGHSLVIHGISTGRREQESEPLGLRHAYTTALRILERGSQTFAWIDLCAPIAIRGPRLAGLPIEPSDLESFVGQIRGACRLGFPRVVWEEEQARVIACRYSRSVHLLVDLGNWRGNALAVLCEAIRQDQCVTKLTIDLNMVQAANDLPAAMEMNTCVHYLTLNCVDVTPQKVGIISDFFDSLRNNQGVRFLSVPCANQYPTVWDRLWSTVATHSSIRTVDVTPSRWSIGWVRREQDLLMARYLRSNTVLQRINYREGAHDTLVMATRVFPVLQLNQFRARALHIRREPTPAARERSFVSSLLSQDVRNDPSFGFVLLTENPDMLVQSVNAGGIAR